jgi:hypothetical protein
MDEIVFGHRHSSAIDVQDENNNKQLAIKLPFKFT